MDKNGRLSRNEFGHIFEETEKILKMKISDDQNELNIQAQEIRDLEEGLKEIEDNYQNNPNNVDLKQRSSLGRVRLTFESKAPELTVNYQVGYEKFSMVVRGTATDDK